ncbi:hypothetical protein GCM10009775_35870 [Microbacterium aoyamense]|uniref:SnoaL-like domain-containing protein n=1 Tax=Microbacterium aoyamense TaxID=344166 RepID=A0ABP5BCX9_9MICO|nr:nuclear transport factor 2 family protein [Microbacterium aoyamense]
MNETQNNELIISTAFENWTRGRGNIEHLLSPDLEWEVPGGSIVSGHYSRQRFIDTVLHGVEQRFRRHGSIRPLRVRLVLADRDWVSVVWDSAGITDADTGYRNTHAWFMRLDQGVIVQGISFFDGSAFDSLWAVVPGREN